MSIARKSSSIDIYIYCSFFISCALWGAFYAIDSAKWVNSFFATSLVCGSYFLVFSMIGRSYLFQRPTVYSSIFFFQILCFIGVAFQERAVGALYMATIPAMMGHYHALVIDHRDQSVRQRTGIGFFAFLLFSMIAFSAFYPQRINFMREGIFIGLFVSWSLATLYAGSSLFQAGIGHFKNFFKNTQLLPLAVERDDSDRLFFHDVINQTHGINLFLSSKLSKGEGISSQQCRDLLGEMRVIQAQIKDHYKLSHKNLVNNYEYVAFASVRKWIDRTVESFLPPELVQSIITYKDLDRFTGVIHYPSFSRIFTNIIKNISEVKTHEVWIHFEHAPQGVVFTVKNLLFDPTANIVNLEQKLRDNILNADRNPIVQGESGLGLESIYRLCKEQGGEFDFYLEDGHWVNKVFLPFANEKYHEVERAA